MADEPVSSYDSKISTKKGILGSVDGALVAAVATLVLGFMKIQIKDMTPEMENSVASITCVLVSAAVLAAKRYIENRLKHTPKTVAVKDEEATPDVKAPSEPAK